MASAGQNATGQTSSEIRSESSEDRVTVSGPSHVFTLETGRGPGKRPPIGVIPKWIVAKTVSITGTIQSASFAISKTIGDKGTRLFQMGGRDDIITPAVSDERIDKLSSDIADAQFNKVLNVIDAFTTDR